MMNKNTEPFVREPSNFRTLSVSKFAACPGPNPSNQEALQSLSASSIFTDEQASIMLVNGQTEKIAGGLGENLSNSPIEKLWLERLQPENVQDLCHCNSASRTLPIGTGLDLARLRQDGSETQLVQTEIEQQLRFEKTLAEISSVFVNLDSNKIDAQIMQSQKRVCETFGLERSTLMQISRDGHEAVVTHSWAADGFQQTPFLSIQDFPWCARTALSGQRLSFARIDDLPVEAAKDKEALRRYGPKANLGLPLLSSGKLVGTLAFGSMHERHEWDSTVVERLGLVAEVFANALARARADEELRQAYREIEDLKHRLEKESVYLREEVKLNHHHNEVIGDGEGIRRVLKKAEQVATTDSTVLVLGETGTGKELIARTIHDHSRRKHKIMVKVNCAALPASLVESELFGRERGAFTGALTREMGRFELANASTILLDEIAELPLELQSKLLRVLQEGEFERLGGPRTIKVDVRVIAATSKNLQQAVHEGKFREDLYYRLNVFPITLPPLRERREDIPALVWHFVNDLSQRMGRSIESIQASTMEAFKNYYWPGNIRELRNVIERFLITNTSTVFRAELPIAKSGDTHARAQTFEEVERNHLLKILELVGWRVRGKGGAAEILGLKATTLESRMQKLRVVRRK
jgi:formate hydrogenlyase transcriptional activator